MHKLFQVHWSNAIFGVSIQIREPNHSQKWFLFGPNPLFEVTKTTTHNGHNSFIHLLGSENGGNGIFWVNKPTTKHKKTNSSMGFWGLLKWVYQKNMICFFLFISFLLFVWSFFFFLFQLFWGWPPNIADKIDFSKKRSAFTHWGRKIRDRRVGRWWPLISIETNNEFSKLVKADLLPSIVIIFS